MSSRRDTVQISWLGFGHYRFTTETRYYNRGHGVLPGRMGKIWYWLDYENYRSHFFGQFKGLKVWISCLLQLPFLPSFFKSLVSPLTFQKYNTTHWRTPIILCLVLLVLLKLFIIKVAITDTTSIPTATVTVATITTVTIITATDNGTGNTSTIVLLN